MQSILYNINIPKEWTNKTYNKFIEDLFSLREESQKKYNEKLIKTKYTIIGIKTKILKELAKKIAKTNIKSYLKVAKKTYYEEVLIKGFVISYLKNYEEFLYYFKEYLAEIDNWALCDQSVASYKIIKKNKTLFKNNIEELLISPREYDVRVGLIILLDYYIEKENLLYIQSKIDQLNREEYYIEMAVAWLVSIMYIKYKEDTLCYIKNNNLSKMIQNKAIQKIRESKRVSPEEKENLLKYKKM